MKNIILPIAILALFFASCGSCNSPKTENEPKSEPVSGQKPLISQIDYTDSWETQINVTLKYDNQNRLTEMVSTDAETPATISYQGETVAVDMLYFPTKYVASDDRIVASVEHNDENIEDYDIVYILKDGKIQESNFSTSTGGNTFTYQWEGGNIKEIHETSDCYGDIFESTTTYTYGTIKNTFNVDLLCMIDNYDFSDPRVGSLFDGFVSEYLPESKSWEGAVDGWPSQKSVQYEYVVNDGLVTEIHITITSSTDYSDQDDGEVETNVLTETVKIKY